MRQAATYTACALFGVVIGLGRANLRYRGRVRITDLWNADTAMTLALAVVAAGFLFAIIIGDKWRRNRFHW